MRTILKNAKIYVDKENFQESMLISDGIIKEVGTDEYILNFEADNVIDLDGKTVLPGLNDSHMHLSAIGEAMSLCDLTPCRSIDEIIETSKRFLINNTNLNIIVGRGWNQDNFVTGEKRILTRFDLDKISTDIPIILKRICAHIATVNSKALKILNIDESTFVDGGEIIIGSDGKPNGILTENAISLTNAIIPEKTDADREKEFLKAAEYAVSVGLTSVQSNDVINDNCKDIFRILHNIYDKKKTKLRYDAQFNFQNINYFNEYLETEFKTGTYDERFLSKGALKLFKDGSLGGRTALMLNDYHDEPGIKGVSALSDEQLKELCDLATSHNIRVITHAIGDGAIESVIKIYERTMDNKNNKNNSLRHGIVHCQITSKKQLEKIAELNIGVMYQPIFLDYDTKIVEQRIGKELASTSYAFNTLNKLCAPISFGTDSPVEDCNPFPNIYCAVTRQRLDGTPVGGYVPVEKLSIEEAIDIYTVGSAYNEFKESFKGRLYKGYAADLVVLNRDIFTVDHNEIKNIKVDLTMIDGEIVFERK
ncbi:amidohydrolase [Sedimentibacter sp.]|uniref:amidohydrolase n=1 Tax=Sedimentibacter sp. TaxID=1960295 RepID=UPI0028ADF4FB|nr:amidohydrolase [Sedimentibacter sp.]